MELHKGREQHRGSTKQEAVKNFIASDHSMNEGSSEGGICMTTSNNFLYVYSPRGS